MGAGGPSERAGPRFVSFFIIIYTSTNKPASHPMTMPHFGRDDNGAIWEQTNDEARSEAPSGRVRVSSFMGAGGPSERAGPWFVSFFIIIYASTNKPASHPTTVPHFGRDDNGAIW